MGWIVLGIVVAALPAIAVLVDPHMGDRNGTFLP
jgi:hypothetical protein